MGKLEIRVSRRYEGVGELAKRLGMTPQHVSQVLHGKRRSPRVEAELEAMGVKWTRMRVH